MHSRQIVFFIWSILKFVFTFFFIYTFIVFILCKLKVSGRPLVYRACQGLVWKGGYTYERFKEFHPEKKYDILVFGSSRANRGINPRVLEKAGYNSYNLATDDQTPLNTEVLVRQYVKPGLCRLVILDVYDKVFAVPDLESTADLIQNLNDHLTALKMATASGDIRSFNSFSVRLMMQNEPPRYKEETALYRGFRELNKESVSFSSNFILYKSIPKYFESLTRTLEYLKSIHVPVLLVSQPMVFLKHTYNHHLFLKDLQPVLVKNNVSFYDFTDYENIISISDYADECHIDTEGANKYTNYLLVNVISKTMIPISENQRRSNQ